jgi:hypothetical protein
VPVDLLEPPHAAHRRALDRRERRATAAVVGVEGDVQAHPLGADAAQGVGERDGVLHGQHGARADAEVRGVRGIAREHEVARAPGLVAHLLEPLPRRRAQQRLARQDVGEDLRGDVEAPVGRQPEPLPRRRGALDDERAGRAGGRVAVRPDPARVGALERERERVEHLRGAQPDVLVATRGDGRPERRGPGAPQAAADAVGGHDEVRVQLGRVGHRPLVLHAPAELEDALGEDVDHAAAVDAVAVAAADVHGLLAADAHDLVAPHLRGLAQPAAAHRIGRVDVVEELLAPRDAPAVRRARRVALDHGDLGPGRALAGQQREVQTGGATSNAYDVHDYILSPDRATAARGRRMKRSGIGVPLRHSSPNARSNARGRSRTRPPPGLWVISPK